MNEHDMSDHSQKNIIVGISGGVDSSIAAYLLKQQGYKVSGLFMKNWEEDDKDNYCGSEKDLSDAQLVCDKLNINLHRVNFSTEYWDKVFKLFLVEYKSGRTPNPDILCNKEIKFNTFLSFAISELGADYIATGHYVRRYTSANKNYLLRGLDENKDQSYFLYTLNQQQLSRTLFPIGNLKKSEVRNIAKHLNLITAKKKDSTGICFIGERKFRDFLARYLPEQPGPIMGVDGMYLGKHNGVIYYTLGQRKGLGIGGIKAGNGSPWYVVDKNIDSNTLLVAQDRNHDKLMSYGCIVKQLSWINLHSMKFPLHCMVKTRYRQKDIPCLVFFKTKNSIEVHFEQPIAAVTPGQSAVFYQGDICLGGGIIEQRL